MQGIFFNAKVSMLLSKNGYKRGEHMLKQIILKKIKNVYFCRRKTSIENKQ